MNKDCQSCMENCAECTNAKLLFFRVFIYLLELVSLVKVITLMIQPLVHALVNKLTVLAQWDITMIQQKRNVKNVNLIA